MIVGPALGRRAIDAEASCHPKMHEQRVGAHSEQQVLAAPFDRVDRSAANTALQIGGNRPAQAPVVYMQFRNMPADDMGRDTAASGFDFGEFRHDMRCETHGIVFAWACRGRTIAQSEC